MAFADPQSVTISGVTTSLPRVQILPNGSVYHSADGNIRLTITSQNKRRYRRTIRLETSKVAGDPLVPATNTVFSMTVYTVIDFPKVGYDTAQTKAVVDGLAALMSASSGAATTKLIGGEN